MSRPSGRVLVAMATYNEIRNLPQLVGAIFGAVPETDILVVDDDSPDGTGAWCDEEARRQPRLLCIRRTGQRGIGSATIAALRHAIEHDYHLVLTMDADFSHPPEFLPALFSAAETADVVIGSRYVAGGAIDGWPLMRQLVSRAVNTASHYLAGLATRDSSGAFRCYRVDALRRIDLAAVRSQGFGYLEEILWHLQRSGAKIVEVPFTFRERHAGRSKASLREGVGKLMTICRLTLARWR
jgi:dolichol-phosphate mannosyltransferase